MQFSTLATLLLAATGTNAANGIIGSCGEFAISGTTFSANCGSASHLFTKTTSVDLKDCFFVLGDGVARCGRGGVGGCTFGKDILDGVPRSLGPKVKITCPDSKGNQVTTTVDLNECIGNRDTQVNCDP
ncbi:hypothetical protein MCOR27_007816 [Pyricularia oryzae]|uniref:Cyanovirin-N domain-containing protein n=1 Tax=Pyricularia grisea TaxID=148305 RepID=A0ABQ8NS62_PYRGI|nr:hypothetical protein MCOR01_009184 [Pyricularia oryzae]KAI6301341.1 hypothetical protein MCOR33_003164 [Pyricularia grisea]KAI6255752.1 hypothetical protein MCOR19_007759 [Pyricularia oryzae]KAI6273063.1 hypothetical protein MCOR26_007067 [Pyricularia oryzae]KAI6273492.1 hypothetical protein MCOR27_007816 [Pyricularia oryzae]